MIFFPCCGILQKKKRGKVVARYQSNRIHHPDLVIDNPWMTCRVFWARVVSSEKESLVTRNAKHSFYEIQYALEGRIGMKLGEGERMIVDESDFIVIPPDTDHQIVDGDREGARFIMAFSLEPGERLSRGALAALNSCLPHRETEGMKALLELLLKKGEEDSPLLRRQIGILAESFLLELVEALSSEQGEKSSGEEGQWGAVSRVEEIISFIHSRGGIGVTVADLARRFGLSQRHLGRLFVSVTGESPKEAINREKRKRIEALVSTTSLSLSEISRFCGFCDEYAMNKFFRRYTRRNLSEFRAIAKR